jgi:hypothetical protein
MQHYPSPAAVERAAILVTWLVTDLQVLQELILN